MVFCDASAIISYLWQATLKILFFAIYYFFWMDELLTHVTLFSKSILFFSISNALFQLSLSVAELFNELSLKYCLIVAYYIKTSSYRDMLYCVHLFLCLRLSLFVSSLCDVFFHYLFLFLYLFPLLLSFF